jgi:hypothetical protein
MKKILGLTLVIILNGCYNFKEAITDLDCDTVNTNSVINFVNCLPSTASVENIDVSTLKTTFAGTTTTGAAAGGSPCTASCN